MASFLRRSSFATLQRQESLRSWNVEKEYPEYESTYRLIDKLLGREQQSSKIEEDHHDPHAKERRKFRYRYLSSALLESRNRLDRMPVDADWAETRQLLNLQEDTYHAATVQANINTMNRLHRRETMRVSMVDVPNVPDSGTLSVKFHLPNNKNKVISVDRKKTVAEVIGQLWRFTAGFLNQENPVVDRDNSVLKICGRNLYLRPTDVFGEIAYVHHCASKDKKIELVLVMFTPELREKLKFYDDQSRDFEMKMFEWSNLEDKGDKDSICHIELRDTPVRFSVSSVTGLKAAAEYREIFFTAEMHLGSEQTLTVGESKRVVISPGATNWVRTVKSFYRPVNPERVRVVRSFEDSADAITTRSRFKTFGQRMLSQSQINIVRPVGINVNIENNQNKQFQRSTSSYGLSESPRSTWVKSLPVRSIESFGEAIDTSPKPEFDDPMDELNLTSSFPLGHLPEAAKLVVYLWIQPQPRDANTTPKKKLLGWAAIQMFDFEHRYIRGRVDIPMYVDKSSNQPSFGGAQLAGVNISLIFPDSNITFGLLEAPTRAFAQGKCPVPPSKHAVEELSRIVDKDPLYTLTKEESQLVWNFRWFLRNKSKALPKVLGCIQWSNPLAVCQGLGALASWRAPSPYEALELLDSRFQCPAIRSFAVQCLRTMTVQDLKNTLLQLVQAIKFEIYHDSALVRFLLTRALSNRTLGTLFFWHLKSEMHDPQVATRYELILEAYLIACGDSQAQELGKQQMLVSALSLMSQRLCDMEGASYMRKREKLIRYLQSFQCPQVQMPFDPSIVVHGLIIPECKVMDSAKAPLWLVFKNVDPLAPPVRILFKDGDDLRQDMLTLQVFNIMNQLWMEEGLELSLTPYAALATGKNQGIIEVVDSSRTVASIQKDKGLNGVFKESSIMDWLNESNHAAGHMQRIVYNFMVSCAGYCVATYAIGLGDRHNDNIMIAKSGHLFHIDFGHFLGNIKTIPFSGGISRERAPFVFTPDFAYVLGGRDSEEFEMFLALGSKAFCVLRENAHIFINLFSLMLSTGMPELTTHKDILYLRKAFALEQDVASVSNWWSRLVIESLNTKATQINFWFHNLVH
ncbi:phosphatidylinositol 3-kinase [Planoprotostelium fungivorum]|uniref:Phosphatidylinositol 3-kinase n=1 Tax=Planoprotostelium fungivorum TaxID=1890364 RepID=A0A2P6N8N1_9EUKA|nr:phosphatidylinositol 3-kinase [Planoprotostelium fungivorum]